LVFALKDDWEGAIMQAPSARRRKGTAYLSRTEIEPTMHVRKHRGYEVDEVES
jgi:hypothetical protein